MVLLSSLHIHDVAPASDGCSACVNHIPHQGHISLDTVHLHDCLLCHFASLPFVAAVAISLTAIPQGPDTAFVQPSGQLQFAASRLYFPRAPPCLYLKIEV